MAVVVQVVQVAMAVMAAGCLEAGSGVETMAVDGTAVEMAAL